jgi:hypothetical protein
MAGGFNKLFGATRNNPDPSRFLGEHVIMVVSHGMATGPCDLDLVAIAGPEGHAQLRPFVRRSRWSHPLQSYFLKSANDPLHQIQQLPNNVKFFFTDTLTGCQFLAYGANRTTVTVEHNVPETVDFNVRWINAQTFAYQIRVAPGFGYGADDVANVVGVRLAIIGWQFYYQTRALGGAIQVHGPL